MMIVFMTLIGVLVGWGVTFLLGRGTVSKKIEEANRIAAQTIKNAEREVETKRREVQLESRTQALQTRTEFEKEVQDRRNELNTRDRRLSQQEESLDRKTSRAHLRERELKRLEAENISGEKAILEKETQLNAELKKQIRRMEEISNLTAEEAKKQLIHVMEREARYDAARTLKQIDEETRRNADRTAKATIVTALQRLSRDYISDATISVVSLPSEGMKGRIIGREGRNIRALESSTGINVIIDDTPDAVIISGFDPYRREVAKIALERLILDGRIHPTRIEEMVEKVRGELDHLMQEEAEKVIFDVGLQDFDPEIVKILGRLKYRTSYGQNNLSHAREASFLAGIMASEIGIDVKLAKRGALLHDIGKTVSQEEEGSHAALGADMARRYGESEKVVNAIAAHHGEVEPICVESVLVEAAEGLSAARPGARRESVETYIKRLEKLEKLAYTFRGVEKAYAIQAGREIRIMVSESEISDAESAMISREIAKKVEEELTYPGQIKVTVIRENRFIDYAR